MRTLNGVFVYLLILIACVNCTSSGELPLQAGHSSATVWQGMPEPITQRYPMMQMESVNNSDGGNAANGSLPVAILLDEADFFSCTEVEVSTLTDEIPNVDVSFIEADIHDALLELSLLTGLSIITDDSIEGIVSINFVDKSVDEVISAVIAPGNYGFRKFDSFIYVGSQSPVSPSFHLLSDTCTYKPVYMQAFEMVKLLTPYYQQYVNYHETLGHISIVAPSSIQARIQKDLRIFDQAPQQILLEMSIVEVSEEALDMLGVKWRREALGGDASAYQENIFRYYDPLAAVYPVAQSLIDSVSALDTDEEVDIRAMPSMVTLNGREANFSSTQTAWLPMQSYSSSSTDNEVNYGVNLRIIPYISRGKQVRLEILQASVSDLTKDLDDLPKLVSHAISTSVIMVDGETLVLGGLMQKKNRSQMSKVPGASNSSLFGGLFKHAEGAMVTTEVLIVIRPKILKS